MTKISHITIFTIFIVLIISALFAPISCSQQIIFGTENHAPYNFINDETGKIEGLAVDVIKAMLVEAGDTENKIKMFPWARIYNMALEQKNVAIFSMSYTKERDPLFKWVGELHNSKSYLWKDSSRGDITINSRQDLSKYKIVVQRNGGDHQIFKNEYGLKDNLHMVIDTQQRYKLIFRGRGDLFAETPFTLKWQLGRDDYENRIEKVYFIPEFGASLNLAFSNETDDIVVNRYKKALKQIKKNGTYQAIITKWTE
ncbi:MAG: ABC transporter substrate-binding protein [Bermanella sp.]